MTAARPIRPHDCPIVGFTGAVRPEAVNDATESIDVSGALHP